MSSQGSPVQGDVSERMSNSVPEAWIPINERFTEGLGKSQEAMRGRENGNMKKAGKRRTVGPQSYGLSTLTRTVWYSVIKPVSIHSSFAKNFQHLFGSRMFIYVYL